ncbi:hypothetical protein Droror1_Dr00007986 [Drosera rotundifolia]
MILGMADHHQQQHHHHQQQQGAAQSSNMNIVMRDYRKGNWTLQETMVLIEAKRMDDERRTNVKRHQTSDPQSSSIGIGGIANKPTELRWKWVEDFCWRRDCLRSQNQCNDKWDNLMRDYKKIRDYQRRLGDDHDNHESSYWKIEKNERKDRGLPTSMLFQIYQALAEVVEKPPRRVAAGGSGGGASASSGDATTSGGGGEYLMEKPISVVHPAALPPMLQQINQPAIVPALSSPPPVPPPLLLPPPPVPPLQVPAAPQLVLPFSYSQAQPSVAAVDSDTSEHSDSPVKRRRTISPEDRPGHQQEQQEHQAPTGTTKTMGTRKPSAISSVEEYSAVGPAITRSATMIVEAIHASEESEERRHKEMMRFHERRIKVEESKVEIKRQGADGLARAINNLANSILTLSSHQIQHQHPPQNPPK